MAGFVVAADEKSCVPCPMGTRWDTGARCVDCEAGTYSAKGEGSTSCALCPSGKAGVGCAVCGAGKYAPVSGLTACLECESLVWDNGTACYAPECGPKEFWRPGLASCQRCTECLDTTYAVAACNASYDTVCGECTSSCPAHYALTRYCTLAEDSVCTLDAPCPPGMYRREEDDVCARCPLGTMSTAADGQQCKRCEEGLFPNGAQTACVRACEVGAYLTIDLYCAPCAPGTGACAPCPANTYAARAGQTACLPCPNGTWALQGSSACSSATCLVG